MIGFYDALENKSKLIAAHRGFRAIRPENTMSAFKAALGKCDFIEFDVTLCKDGIAVVIHDKTLKRTSNIIRNKKTNKKKKIHDFTYEELLMLDFASWFIEKDPFDTIKDKRVNKNDIKADQILTLKQVLEFCKKKNLLANIEIKNMKKTPFHKKIVKEIIKVVQETRMQKKVLLSSFNHSYLKKAKKIAPYIHSAALVEKKHPKDLLLYLKKLDVHAYNCEDSLVDKKLVKLLKDANYKINVFTVNNKKRKKELFSLGVDAIFTDFL